MPYQAGKLRLQHLLSFPGIITRDLIPQPSQGGERLGYLWSRCQALEDWVVRVIVFWWSQHWAAMFVQGSDDWGNVMPRCPFWFVRLGRTLGSIQAMGQCIKQCNVMQVMLSLLSLPSWSFLFISVMSPSKHLLQMSFDEPGASLKTLTGSWKKFPGRFPVSFNSSSWWVQDGASTQQRKKVL